MQRLLLVFFLLTHAGASFCQKKISKKLDELMKAYNTVNKFNGTILVSQDGNILLEKGYGLKNVESRIVNDAKSIFQIYSVTKTFTSTMVLKLVEQKKLSLSDKLSKFYPSIPKADSITIENLLSHTSGITDETQGNNNEQPLIKFLETQPLNFSPGTSWRYSNTGYRLLGFIIQRITALKYEEAIKRYIFTPLQMSHSGFDFKRLSSKDKTTGYEIFSDKYKEAEIYEAPGPFAAGAIYSTVGDLYKYHRALQSYKMLKKESLLKAYTPVENNYGYGWMIRSYEGDMVVSHSGGAAGYRSNFVRIPEKNICIVLLDNTENSNVEFITKNLLAILYNNPYKIPAEIKLDTGMLQKYIGYYRISPTFSIQVTTENGRLIAEATGQGKTVLLAEKENYFFSEEANDYLEFTQHDGEYAQLVLYQGEKKTIGKRFYPTWGLIGTATAKGWEENIPDIQFTQVDTIKGLWVLNNILLNDGELKFRFNNDWNINYGDDNNDKILDKYGKNIKIEAGRYSISLDFTNNKNPIYSIVNL